MANPVVFNIMKSGAVVWYAPQGEAVPDETSVAAGAAWGGNWAKLGATKEAVTFAYEDERSEINVEEFLAAVNEYRISESAMIETVLAEVDLDYLQLGLEGTVTATAAGASQKGYEELPVGNVAVLTKRSFGLEGLMYDSSANVHPFRIFFKIATAKLNGEQEFSRRSDQYTGVPLQIKALADPDTSGRLFTLQRVTAPATS